MGGTNVYRPATNHDTSDNRLRCIPKLKAEPVGSDATSTEPPSTQILDDQGFLDEDSVTFPQVDGDPNRTKSDSAEGNTVNCTIIQIRSKPLRIFRKRIGLLNSDDIRVELSYFSDEQLIALLRVIGVPPHLKKSFVSEPRPDVYREDADILPWCRGREGQRTFGVRGERRDESAAEQ